MAFRPYVKGRGLPFTVAVVYVITRAANAIPEFRYRIRPGEDVNAAAGTVSASTSAWR
ncbi:MAG: hypothetical protein Kow00124_24330 [Anaerolineae bacterium]